MRGIPVTRWMQGQYDEKIAGTVLEAAGYPTGDGPSWEQEDEAADSIVARDAAELRRRSKLLSTIYPFTLEDGSLSYQGSSTLVYEFCLCASLTHSFTKGKFARIPRVFERIAGRLAAAYLGPDSRWYRLGWPPLKDRPKKLRDAIGNLRDATGEWLWGPLPALENDLGPRKVKDGGIDLVVWQPFGDGRVGQLFLLGQCACGNDWPDKLRDLHPEGFKQKWLRVMSYCDVVRFMAIPRHVPEENDWVVGCTSGGILLDRVRLTLLAARSTEQAHGFSSERAELLQLIKLMLPQFVEVKAAGA